MKIYKTRPIGEIFENSEVKLQVVEKDDCIGCYFWSKKSCHDFIMQTGYCGCGIRKDHKNVIFKQIIE